MGMSALPHDLRVRTSGLFIGSLFHLLTVFDLIYKDLGWFKTGNKVLINYQGSVPGDVSGNFLFALLIDETAKAPDINVVAVCHGILHHTKKRLHRCSHISLVDSGLFGDLVYYICFSHFVFFFSPEFFREAKFRLP